MAELVARAILNMDAGGLVGAARDAETALDALNKKAAETGSGSGGGLSSAMEAETVAAQGLTQAQEKVNAIMAAGQAERAAMVSQLQSAATAADGNAVRLGKLTAAQIEYSNSVRQARTLLAQGQITQTEYNAAVGSAAARMALGKLGAEGVTAANGMKLAGWQMTQIAQQTNDVVGGFIMGQSAFQITAQQMPQFIQLYQMSGQSLGAFLKSTIATLGVFINVGTLAGAAIVGAALATDQYAASIGKVNIAAQAHGVSLAAVSTQYSVLIGQMSDAGAVSEKTAREMAVGFMDVNIDPSNWTKITTLARDYAAVLGTTTAEAAAKLAESLKDPTSWAIELTKQYGLLDGATIAHIRHLQEAGDKQQAQEIVTQAWADRIKGAKDQTEGWARAWNAVATSASNAWDALGKTLFGSNDPAVKLRDLEAELTRAKAGLKSYMMGSDGLMIDVSRPVDQILADIARVKAAMNRGSNSANNKESLDIGAIVQGYGAGSIDAKIDKLKSERERILADQKKGVVIAGADGQTISYEKALALNTQETNKALKEKRDALMALNPEAKRWADQIKSLNEGSAQEIAKSDQAAKAAKERLAAYGQGALALQQFDDKQAIANATLQYSIAADHASGAAKEKLLSTIQDITAAMEKNQAATHALAAEQEITSKMSSLPTTGLNETATASLSETQFDIAKKALDQWREKTVADLSPENTGYAQFRAYVEQLYDSELAKLYDDDLNRRKDWASGIERSNRDSVRSMQDMASQSKELLDGWNSTAENIFTQFATNGKTSISDLVNYAVNAMAKLAYQKYLSSAFSSLGSSVLDTVAGALGIDTGGAIDTSMSGFLNGEIVGVSHSGGTGDNPPAYRIVSGDTFYGASRYHTGKRGAIANALDSLSADERAVIVKSNEEIVTADDSRAAASAISNSGGVSYVSAAPNVSVKTYNYSSSKVTAAPSVDSNGNVSIEVLVDAVENALVERNMTGNSALVSSLEQTHNLSRTPSA